MIPVGHHIMLNDAEHDHYQVLRVVERLTNRLYLAARVCPNHEEEPHDLPGMVVIDVKVLAEHHPEWGPRGIVFASHEELCDFLEPSGDPVPVKPPPFVRH